MELGKPVTSEVDKVLRGEYDSTEVVEITYKIKSSRSRDGYVFYNEYKVNKHGTWVKQSGFCSDWWENTSTGETEDERRYDPFGDEV